MSRLPDNVARRLAEHDLAAERVASVLGWPADHAVLLAGSFAESMDTSASDLDFLVLRESGEATQGLAAQRELTGLDVQASTLVDRILVMIGGVEFDVCILTRSRLTDLATVLQTCVAEDGTIRSLPVLRYLEDKLLCRLHDGIVLQNDAQAARWRSFLRIDHLPALLTAAMVSDTLSLLEDAVTLPLPRSRGGLDNPFGGLLAARAAAERLLRAAVTSVGIVGWDLRYATLYRDRLAAAGDEVPAALSALEELLFPAAAPDALDDYVRALTDHTKALIGGLEKRPGMRAARGFLREFGSDRWALDPRLVNPADDPAVNPAERPGRRPG